jgi:hypothetical protein
MSTAKSSPDPLGNPSRVLLLSLEFNHVLMPVAPAAMPQRDQLLKEARMGDVCTKYVLILKQSGYNASSLRWNRIPVKAGPHLGHVCAFSCKKSHNVTEKK